SNSSFEALDDRARFFKAGWARNLHANVLLDIPFLRLHTLNGYSQPAKLKKNKGMTLETSTVILIDYTP
ncbi:MAG: hypothetical protein AB7F31_03725, partial [Parachlamydiales bacterium]